MEKFSYFMPAYFEKSGDGQNIIKVGGCITDETKDSDGETLLTKGLDFSYFTGGWGKIKYEHADNPDNFIGAPTKLIKKGNEVHFEGELYNFEGVPEDKLTPQQKMAKSAYGLLQNTNQWNNTHSSNQQQKVGWSVEGEYLDRDRKTGVVKKARITNVVLTTKPKNTKTYAELVKSLEVGYAHGVTDQTGFGATRLQSIDKKVKRHVEKGMEGEDEFTNTFNQSIQEQNPMKAFKSKSECHAHYMSKGLSEDEAGFLADKWEDKNKVVPEKDEKDPKEKEKEALLGKKKEEEEEVEKSLGVSQLRKSLEGITAMLKIQPDYDVNEFDKNFAKSIGEGDAPDLTGYFKTKQEVDLTLMDAQIALSNKIDLLGKSVGVAVSGMIQMAKTIGLNKSLGEINARALAKALNIGSQSKGIVTSEIINNIEIVDNNESTPELTKSQTIEILDAMASKGMIKSTIVTMAETGYIDAEMKQLAKSNRNLLSK